MRYRFGFDWEQLAEQADKFIASVSTSHDGLSGFECDRMDAAHVLAMAAWDFAYSDTDDDHVRLCNAYKTYRMISGLRPV